MKIDIRNKCADFGSYRAARVKSLFNVDSGASFELSADLPIDGGDWKIGVVVGPSGSGKTSIGRKGWPDAMYEPEWPGDAPIVDAIVPGGSFDEVTAALAAVGLGDVPSWLRPYHVLSNGEKFRATLARLIAEAPDVAVVDEFSSVVDRQIAKIGALAFSKSWRRSGGKAVLLSCHYDILDWLQPDWVFDTASGGEFHGRWHQQRPPFDLEIFATNWRYWPMFAPHHYLKAGPMPAGRCYIGVVDGQPVCHLGVSSMNLGKSIRARACRLVVMPEWQGAGVGLRFLNTICQWQLEGDKRARFPGRKVRTVFHTSHPGLCAALRRMKTWRQISGSLHGGNKKSSASSIARSARTAGVSKAKKHKTGIGYGGHFRAVQGFIYVGAA